MTSNYTIIEPSAELFEPPNSDNYLEFLERCTRVCYKSEEHIKLGSAEKLMNKVVNEYEHYSVTEHANLIVELEFCSDDYGQVNREVFYLIKWNPMFAYRVSPRGTTVSGRYRFLLSGNIRMWVELFAVLHPNDSALLTNIRRQLHKKVPFFFENYKEREYPIDISQNTTKKDKS